MPWVKRYCPWCLRWFEVLAAKKLGRRAIGIDLSEKYLALAQRRLSEVPLSLGLEI